MCNECYDNSYLDYPVYGDTVLVWDTTDFWDKAKKIKDVIIGVPPREDEGIYDYLVKNEDRPSAPFAVGAAVDGGVVVGLALVFGIRDTFRLISRKLGDVYIHPSYVIFGESTGRISGGGSYTDDST